MECAQYIGEIFHLHCFLLHPLPVGTGRPYNVQTTSTGQGFLLTSKQRPYDLFLWTHGRLSIDPILTKAILCFLGISAKIRELSKSQVQGWILVKLWTSICRPSLDQPLTKLTSYTLWNILFYYFILTKT